ncbi:uncharacterized protein LOC143361128 [Halictus rubicundus]|uniref:uncharacterized protein LOC143361128 n=1 Tax=Halictus rubicundus TaxID=77578 RepID=UPI00403632D8
MVYVNYTRTLKRLAARVLDASRLFEDDRFDATKHNKLTKIAFIRLCKRLIFRRKNQGTPETQRRRRRTRRRRRRDRKEGNGRRRRRERERNRKWKKASKLEPEGNERRRKMEYCDSRATPRNFERVYGR